MSIVDRPFPASAALPAGFARQAPITLAMYDRMIYESRSTHRGDQFVRPLARPEAALSPAELFLPG
jgi:hypothetical protein